MISGIDFSGPCLVSESAVPSSCSVGRFSEPSNGRKYSLPSVPVRTSELTSSNLELMCCSFHICVVERRVYL